MPKRFHLAWFTNFTAGDWNAAFSHGGSPWDGKFYVEFGLALERTCFDYIMLEDTLMVSEALSRHRGSDAQIWTAGAEARSHTACRDDRSRDVAARCRRTMSTMAWPPFMLARVSTTIDHIAGGRFGWNIVTSGEDAAAQNFGLDKLPPRELRYAMADEYMELVYRLSTPFQRTSRRFINEVCEGLVPALQQRRLVRQAYTRPTLRETLREF